MKPKKNLFNNRKIINIFLILFLGILLTIFSIKVVQAAVDLILAEKTVLLLDDLDENGIASPGDILEYTITIFNQGATNATGVVFNDTLDINTALVTDSLIHSPIAVPDVFPQTVLGNVRVDSSRIGYTVLTNDNLGQPAITEISLDSPISSQGGNVTMVTSGSSMGQFTYDPPPGYEGTDTFTYTLTNSAGSSTSTVSLIVSKMIWFINNNAATCTTLVDGCGRLSKPFSSLASFVAINNGTGNNPGANDVIFLYESNTNYSGAISLLSGQKLIGQDASDSLANMALVVPASSSDSLPSMNTASPYTTLGNTVTLNSNTTVRGLRINITNNTGMMDPVAAITNVTVSEVSITSNSGTGVNFSSTAGVFNFDNITSYNGTNGIVLDNFTGSFTLPAGYISNTYSDGIKLNYASNVTISNITINGAARNSTNPACNFTSISTACEAAIEILNSKKIALSNIIINQDNMGMQGIVAQNTEDLTIKNSQVLNVGDADNESGMLLNNLYGTILFEDLTINTAQEFGLRIYQTAGVLSGTLRRVKIQNNNGTFGEDGLSIRVEGGTSTILVDDSNFLNTGGSGVAASVQGSGAVLNITLKNSSWSENHQLPHAVSFTTAGSASGSITIQDNGMVGCANSANCFGAIDLDASDSSHLDATISGNTSSASGAGTGIEFIVNDFATGRATISNNSFSMQPDRIGMNFLARSVSTFNSTGSLHLSLTGNTINGISSNPENVFSGMNFQSGSSSGTHAQTLCVNASGNIINGVNTYAYLLSQRTGTTFQLQGLTGLGTNEINVENFVKSNNPDGTLAGITDVAPAGGTTIVNYVAGNCFTPTTTPQPASDVSQIENIDSISEKAGQQDYRFELEDFNNPPDLLTNVDQSPVLTSTKGVTSNQIPQVSLGVLPPGSSVVIQYQVTINDPLNPINASQVINQGTISGSNFVNVLTDDPSVLGFSDPTIMLLPKPDLLATKTNNVSGVVTLPDPWNWKIRLENKGNYQAEFSKGEPLLIDELPDSGLTYANLAISPGTMSEKIDCTLDSNTLSCVALNDLIFAAADSFDVSFGVTPSTAGLYTNPRSAGICTADPNGLLVELNFENNVCSDTVAVNTSPRISSNDTVDFLYNTANLFTIQTSAGYPTDTTITFVGTLPDGVTFLDLGDGSATIAGTPIITGSFSLTITASNSAGLEATQNFTLTVNRSPLFTSGTNASFTTGVAGSFAITTAGYPTSAITYSSNPVIPVSLTLSDNGDGTATLSGTPTTGDGGEYTLTLTAANGVSPNASQTLTVSIGDSPAITSGNNTTFKVGTIGSFTITASGYPKPTFSHSGSLPDGVSLTDNLDGTASLGGTQAAGSGGLYSLVISAANGIQPDATQNFTLTVNESPAFTSGSSVSFTTGAAGSFVITTAGYPTSAITYTSIPALPASLTFSDNGDGTATLSGTPATGDGGSYELTLTGSNGVNPNATQTLIITIGQSPAITSTDNATFEVGTSGSFTIATSGYPDSSISLTGSLPNGVIFTNNLDGTASLSGTPTDGTGGVYLLNITAENSISPKAEQSFTLTVNEAPEFTNADHVNFNVDAPGSFTIRSDGYPLAAITYASIPVLPASVTLVDNADGTATLSGTPQAGDGGVYTISLSADNGIDPDAIQGFTLTIGESPVFTSFDQVTFVEGNAGSFTITTSGTPVATITFTGDLPDSVSLVDQGDGTAVLSGSPVATTAGTYPISIKASNGVGEDAIQVFNLIVQSTSEILAVNSNEDSGDGVLEENEYTNVAITQLMVTFKHAMDPKSVIDSANYLLEKAGESISIDSIIYALAEKTATLSLQGGLALSDGEYKLTVNGKILDYFGYPIGEDFVLSFFVDTVAIEIIPFGFTLEDGTSLKESMKLTRAIQTLEITFNEDAANPLGDDQPNDVTNPENYLLVQSGSNGDFDTTSCEIGLTSDDILIPIGPIVYNNNSGNGPFKAKITLNNNTALPNGLYRLFVCGSTSISDLAGNKLNDGNDLFLTFSIQVLSTVESLPATGFAPGRLTDLFALPKEKVYQSLGDLWLELPTQGIKAAITGVPWQGNNWDLTWLNQQIGWLEGTAFPTWNGNTVLTAHAYKADGTLGPFAFLKNLKFDDIIIIHYQGLKYTYAVRSRSIVSPSNTTLLSKAEKNDWLTLITCQQYDETTQTYLFRTIVRAVLIQVENEN